ncbi:MAG: hypothetical protein GY950_09535 [bacterium]|nr:hypothetical protein [bacterium]
MKQMKQKNMSKLFTISIRLFPVFMLLLFAGTGILHAADGSLPKAGKIFDGYIKATGGLAAYKKINNRVSKMTMELTAQGIKMSMTTSAAKPDKTYVLIESDAVGKAESGVSGGVVWEKSALQGPQIKEGKERAYLLKTSVFDRMVYWRKAFKKVECTGMEDVDGKPAYKVVATPNEGEEEIYFFDKASNLIVKAIMTMENAMGKIKMEMYSRDYKKVDGILMAHSMKGTFVGQEIAITLNSVEHNVELPKDRFALPKEIQALLDKKKQEAKSK